MASNSLDFSFASEAVDDGTLLVTKIVGEEQVSELFRFEVDLLAKDPNLDIEALLYAPSKLGFRHQIELAGQRVYMTRWVHGVLSDFSVVGEEESWIRYRAVLVPHMWLLTQGWRSRVFLESSTSKNIKQILADDYGLAEKVDFEFTMEDELDREYVVQYDESDYAFVARWLEDEGIHYYFTNDGTAEKIVFGNQAAHPPIEGNAFLPYLNFGGGSKGVGTAAPDGDEAVRGLSCKQIRRPKDVALNDYNWRDPSQELDCEAEVQPRGIGVQYEYNNHYKTPAEGKILAGIRSDELKTNELVYTGNSNCPSFRPGYTFTLSGHFREDFNREYMLTKVFHTVEQGIALSRGGTVTGASYNNSFEAIASERVFRPERKTPWPSIKGVMHGQIDTAELGEYAELDDYGRYKVRIPFDHKMKGKKKESGAASRYLRMAQPYAGQDAGMHFPLLKGTEVLLSHIDGDPDRPIIASAVPNPETMSPVTAAGGDNKRNRIHTKAGNRFQLDDDQKRGGLRLEDSAGGRVFATTGPMRPKESSDVEGGGAGLWGDLKKLAKKIVKAKPHTYTQPWQTAMANTKLVVPDYDLNPKLQQVFDLGVPSQFEKSGFPTKDNPKKSAWDDIIAEDGTSAVLDCITATHITEVRVGNKYNIEHGAFKLTYGDIGADITVSTSGGYAFIINEAGDPATSEALNMGGTVDRTYTEGTAESWEKVKGNVDSYSEVTKDVKEVSKVSGGTNTEETVEGGTHSVSTVKGDEHTEEYRYGTKFQFSLTAGAFNAETVNGGAFNENTLNGGAVSENTLNVGVVSNTTINVIAMNENTLTLGAIGGVDLCIGARVDLELTLAGILDTKIGLAAALEIIIQGGTTSKIELHAMKDKFIIPNETEVQIDAYKAALKNEVAYLKKTEAQLKKDEVQLSKDEAQLKKQGAALDKQISALRNNDAILKKESVAMRAEMTSLMEQRTNLKGDLTALNDSQTTLKSDITSLNANVAGLVVKVGA